MNGNAYHDRHGGLLAFEGKSGSPGILAKDSSGPSSPFAKALGTSWKPQRSSFRTPALPRSLKGGGILTLFGRIGWFLIPSFIQNRLAREPPKPDKLFPTSYLDGMRGLAAFAVFICHMSYQTWQITVGYGAGAPGENTWPIQLPIIRLFYSGPPMVAIFFVISGFALSYKPLKQMRAKQWDGLMATMSSAVFRRPFRLFLPCFASTFMVAMLCQLGIYDMTRPFAYNMRMIIEEHAWTAPDLYSQLEQWAYLMFDFVHPWDWFIYGGSVSLDRHLWTIPTEFRASMVLFLTHFMVARLTPALRLMTWVGLIYWAIHWDRWEVILFWAGAFLAEVDLIRIDRKSRNPPDLYLDPSKKPMHARRRETLWQLFWYANMLCALFLASYPDALGHDTPGYRYLTTLIPVYYSEKLRFWQSIGAVQLIWATNQCDQLKALYTNAPVQYLGKISFALYLMHGPVIHTIGYMVSL